MKHRAVAMLSRESGSNTLPCARQRPISQASASHHCPRPLLHAFTL